jgi:hypothetical protein
MSTSDRDDATHSGAAPHRGFIKVVEVWLPSPEGPFLKLGAGSYGTFTEFGIVSKNMTFPFDAGLPGKAWASRRPLILGEFANSYFKRTVVARAAGLTCGVALPVIRNEELLAVVVLFMGVHGAETGAVEIWSPCGDGKSTLALEDVYYGAAELSRWTSEHILMRSGLGAQNVVWPARYRRGEGMPGRVWETGRPWLTDNPMSVYPDLRHSGPGLDIDAVLGIPWLSDPACPRVLTLLSSRTTPIARRMELWEPEGDSGALKLVAAAPDRAGEAFAHGSSNGGSAIHEAIELAARTLVPQLIEGLAPAWPPADASPVLPATGLVLPILQEDGTLGAVAALVL